MAIPLTARLRALARGFSEAEQCWGDKDALDHAQTLREAADALDAREGQTCGNGCRSYLAPVASRYGKCTRFGLEPIATFGCNQWTPKEPQP